MVSSRLAIDVSESGRQRVERLPSCRWSALEPTHGSRAGHGVGIRFARDACEPRRGGGEPRTGQVGDACPSRLPRWVHGLQRRLRRRPAKGPHWGERSTHSGTKPEQTNENLATRRQASSPLSFPGGSANLSREPGRSSNQGHSITPDGRKGAAISGTAPHNLAIDVHFRHAIALAQGLIAPLVSWVFPQVTHECVKERKDAGQAS